MMGLGWWLELTWALTLGCLVFLHLAVPLLWAWPARVERGRIRQHAAGVEDAGARPARRPVDGTKPPSESPARPAAAPRTFPVDGELALARRMAARRRRAGLPPTPSSIRVLQAGHRMRSGSPMAWSAGAGDRQEIAGLGGSLPRGDAGASGVSFGGRATAAFSGSGPAGTSFEPSAAGGAR